MPRGLALTLRWTGRILVLLGPYVLVCSLFLPAGVQFLNPVVCPEGLELSNARDLPAGLPDNAKLELVCTSPTYSVSVGPKILLVVAGLIASGLTLMYVSDRALRPRYRSPVTPSAH